ncbi:MAG: bifunctional 4-hydroxy-2-oxoglutarate aldolase/2-dehydro-3-deoxy-phosphogluconate aldolase [Deltaproteobacteria bacterium]|nr:bifunctional 4-hydroxy-2-oxoglutarate aldolase/2-dehydro-3-deoxy-phosphogluconate aldolase [Deltaproteobacteria bacterium]
MQTVMDELHNHRLIPVIAIHDAKNADPLADSLALGGLPCAEITFRTEAAADAISAMAAKGNILVGAGTVLKIDQAKAAVDAGARFIVSPGFNPKVVRYCLDNDIAVTPGVCTPTEIEQALDFGLEVLKFFPAESFGGLKTLKAMSAPYGMTKFIPTGGIGPKNVLDYLKFDKVWACGGSWMVKSDMIAEQNFEEISRLVREAVQIVKQASA